MATDPLPITVIIPCFNDAKTLPAAVQSAIDSQVEKIMLVNDGSTDPETRAVVESFDGDVVTVFHIENSGSSGARSYALAHVTTPYVFNLDADDKLLPGGLSRLHGVLSADSSCGVAWGDYCVFGEWNHIQNTADCIDPWQLTILNDLPVSALFRTETLVQAGGWRGDGYEDWDLWMSLAENGIQGKRLPLLIFCYRTHPAAAMRQRARDELRHESLLCQMRARHPELFRSRGRALLSSCCPWRVRLALTLARLVPLSGSRQIWFLWRVNQLSHGRFATRFRERSFGLSSDLA